MRTKNVELRGAKPGEQGQAAFVPTPEQRKQVLEFKAVGLARAQMAQLIKKDDGAPISVKTLERHFPEELNHGGIAAIANVGGVLYRGAMAGNPALIRLYWNINAHRYGLSPEQQRHEHTGKDGGPITTIDWSDVIAALPEDARPAMLSKIEQMIAAATESDDAKADDAATDEGQ